MPSDLTNSTCHSEEQILALAALIREVDGAHRLGATALAEKLIERGVVVVLPNTLTPGSAALVAGASPTPDAFGN